MADTKENYRDLRDELDGILQALQAGDLDIEEATKQYERAVKIVDKLEAYINKAENKITKVKKKIT
jgi:exodeoxyribonuclease VII small subunit